jgi:quinoprotein glucose dehydrogenase
VYSEDEGRRGAAAPRQLSGRGLAYWSDGREERILYVTPGYRLIALEARTGQRVSGFGQDGVVDLKQGLEGMVEQETAPVGLHSTPLVAGDVVLVGAAFEGGANPRGRANVKGAVRAFDARTGRRLWTFNTASGRRCRRTWSSGSRICRWSCPRTTTTGARVPETTCSARASWPWT